MFIAKMSSPMTDSLHSSLIRALYLVLKPLIRLLLRHGIPYSVFADIARHLYVEVAKQEFSLEQRKPSASRISILTGINRRDVRKLEQQPNPLEQDDAYEYNRAARVVGGWVRDAQYRDQHGLPRALEFDGLGSFSELVKRHGGDVPPRAMLDELLRAQVASQREGKIYLLSRDYLPENAEEKMRIASRVLCDLLNTLDHNLLPEQAARWPQRSLSYSNIPLEALPELRLRSRHEIQQFLQQTNQWFALSDRDINPAIDGTGQARAGISLFYFEEPLTPAEKADDASN